MHDAWLPPLRLSVLLVTLLALMSSLNAPPIVPVIRHDFADPAVLASAGGIYAYSTESRYQGQIWHVPVQLANSPQGRWRPLGDALPRLPEWVVKDARGQSAVWAPAVATRAGGGYVLYFAAPAGRVRCIGAAVSTSPAGPFTPASRPLVCQPENHDSIDPATFTDGDGSRYLLYTNGRQGSTIWLQRLAEDGLSPLGPPRALIHADRPEEANIVEAPTLTYHDGRYLLFYCGNTFNSGRYFVNYATAWSLDGEFTKHPGALLGTADLGGGLTNPGGQDVLPRLDPAYLVFHAFTAPGRRSMFIVNLAWKPDGTPRLGLPEPAGAGTAAPPQPVDASS